MAVVVTATWEDPWPGRCDGVRGGVGRCEGDARGCAVEGADGGATAEWSREFSEGLRGVAKSSLNCNAWGLGARRAVESLGVVSSRARVHWAATKLQELVVSYHSLLTKPPMQSPYVKPQWA
jgi:hypothetical protein